MFSDAKTPEDVKVYMDDQPDLFKVPQDLIAH